jgi:hypothetical protein
MGFEIGKIFTFNPLTEETCLLSVSTQRVPRSKHSPPWLQKKSSVMLYKAIVSICYEIRIKHANET